MPNRYSFTDGLPDVREYRGEVLCEGFVPQYCATAGTEAEESIER